MTEEATVRVLDFDGYRDVIEGVDEHAYDDEGVRWIIGTQAPKRDFDDLREEAEFAPDDPAAYLDDPTIDSEPHKQYGDFGFPSYGFVDEDTTDDLEAADAQLVGLFNFPESAVNPTHHRVLETSELLEHVDALEEKYGDDHVLMTGAWSPVDHWQIMNDGDQGVGRIGETIFPSEAIAGTGIEGLQKAAHTLAGTLVLERSVLTSDVLTLVDDDVESVGPEDVDDQAEEQGAA